jgi:hypothetical protein
MTSSSSSSLLKDLINNTDTDKDTVHSYLPLYQRLLEPKKDSAKHVLEVGIGDFKEKNGGSIKLWHDFFPNATIYGIDIIGKHRVIDELLTNDRIVLYPSSNAYDEAFFKTNFLDKNIKCDMMLDDGPHTLESMKSFIRLYSQIMTDDGILMVEDVQSMDWIPHLKEAVPEHLKEFVHVYDLRWSKGRYDDIVFTIEKQSV